MKTTAEIVEKAKNGDQAAWTELYNATYSVAFGVAMQLVKNVDVVNDMLQDSYVTAYTKLDTLQEPEKFQNWFNRIVANNCKNYLVKKKPELFSEKTTLNEDGEEIQFDIEDKREEFQPDTAVYTDEIKTLFYEMLDKLPEEQKACVLMCWVQDLTIAQAAEILGVSENTVKSRLHYAKKKLSGEAEEMKKKGISVFSITGFAIIPFVRWLFAEGSNITADPQMATSVLEMCKSAGSAVNTVSKATEASKTVVDIAETAEKVNGTVKAVSTTSKIVTTVSTVTKTVVFKIVAGVLAVAIAIGCASPFIKSYIEDNKNVSTEEPLGFEEESYNEILSPKSVEELGLDSELVKAVANIINCEYIGTGDGNVIDVDHFDIGSFADDTWFYVYWTYYYLIMSDIYTGNELQMNEELRAEIPLIYGTQNEIYYEKKERCGVPDYDSFVKIYSVFSPGMRDDNLTDEYNKLIGFLKEYYYIVDSYGMWPHDVTNLQESTVCALDDSGENYQIEYSLESYRGGGYRYEGNKEYVTYNTYTYSLSLHLDKDSVFGFVVVDSSVTDTGRIEKVFEYDYDLPQEVEL